MRKQGATPIVPIEHVVLEATPLAVAEHAEVE